MAPILKRFCIAAFALLAISAGIASTALAAEYHSEITNTTIKGEQIGEEALTFNAGTVKCKKVTETGTVSPATASEIELEPEFSECTAFGFVNTLIDRNGCKFKWTWLPPTLHLVCPAGKTIHITAFNCWVKIGPQTISGLAIVKAGIGIARIIKLIKSFSGLLYTQESKSFPGCTNGSFTNGTWSGESELKGFNSEGKQVGIWSE